MLCIQTFLLETLINSSSISLDYFGFLYLWSYHLHITTILIRYACFSLPNYIGYNIRLNRSGDRNQPFLVADFKRKSFNASPLSMMLGFPGKESTCKAGDPSSIPGLGRFTGEGIGYPLQYSFFFFPTPVFLDFPCGSDGKESAFSVRDLGSIPGLGRSLEKGMATHPSILA